MRRFLLTHVVHEVFDLDGKLARTLQVVLTQPGRLAADYVAGRRKPFVSPLRLYLITSSSLPVERALQSWPPPQRG
jgi:hypothetical protein